MRHLMLHLARRRAGFLLACALLLGGLEFLITAVVSSVNLNTILETVMSSLPPLLQAVLQSEFFGGLTELGLIAFGWNHPAAHALGAAVAIVLASRAIAGEVEAGTIELVLSQPLSRRAYFAAHASIAWLALALLTLAGLGGTLLGIRVFHLEPAAPGSMVVLGLDYFLLQWAWFGIALALSAVGREGGHVATIGFLAAIVSYVGQAIGTLWEPAEFLLPWTLPHYFAPQTILVRGENPLSEMAVLLGVGLTGHAVAAWRFTARDLP